MKELTHVSLFSGIGGIDLAAEWAGFTSVAQVEWEDFPTKILEKNFPNAERWRDIHDFRADELYARTGRREITLVSGGFPCQPFSVAGRKRGKDDDRYLWPEMYRVIRELKPRWVLGENVDGFVRMGLDETISNLEDEGYAVRTFSIPAVAVGAHHQRQRTFIVGCRIDVMGNAEHHGPLGTEKPGSADTAKGNYKEGEKATRKSEGASRPRDDADMEDANGSRLPRSVQSRSNGRSEEPRDAAFAERPGEAPRTVPDAAESTVYNAGTKRRDEINDEITIAGKAKTERQSGSTNGASGAENGGGRRADAEQELDYLLWRGGLQYSRGIWAAEPMVARMAHGIPDRVDRIKGLGNAVVPQQVYPILKAIADIENGVIR